jgi:CelD/BcsL family acetyltransferase involved in cellulose biosynthesis
MGRVACAIAGGGDEASFHRIAQEMVRQKEARYREIHTRDFLEREAYQEFFVHPTKELLMSELLQLSGLYLDDKLVTTHWGMVYRDRFYYYMPSFASGPWMRYSPGRMLLFHLFMWCFKNDIKIFDFTIGDEPYKRSWCDEELPLWEYLGALTRRGRIFGSYHRIRRAMLNSSFALNTARKMRRLFYRIRYTVD